MLQKIFLEPLSSCYAEGAYGMVEDSDTREWSLESSHAAGSAMSGSDRSPPNSRRDEDEESEVTLNGLTDDAHQQQSPGRSSVAATTSSWSDAAMSRDHGSAMSRDHSSSSRSGFGITALRDMPSFSASSVAGSPGRLFGGSATPSFSEDSLMSEYESKLPNINTIRRPINPAMIPP